MSDTLFLAISYVDRFLSMHAVPRAKLQLVGVACMLLAAKYEEIYAPQARPWPPALCLYTCSRQALWEPWAAQRKEPTAAGKEVSAPVLFWPIRHE